MTLKRIVVQLGFVEILDVRRLLVLSMLPRVYPGFALGSCAGLLQEGLP